MESMAPGLARVPYYSAFLCGYRRQNVVGVDLLIISFIYGYSVSLPRVYMEFVASRLACVFNYSRIQRFCRDDTPF